ncbi:M13 family metallopeptidase [Tunturiibacter gelidoferens]|jgi:putative endopeptidase|uniref:Endopeptidase n=1 Tax=Tunturiibacter gelidiferens TaxID=3069689 RepID=A0A9X0QK20_9BACT|nr:M13 family metallopeptidase [Edaphobacter lichenicola]MBB5331744.1 putative endopeptidase [Edaphobacter lichenicola]
MRLQNVVPLLILAGGLYLAPKTAFGQILDSGLNLDAGPTSVPKKLKSLDLSAIDKTADPCTNFYQYACGNWMKNNPLPADQTHWNQVIQLTERNSYLLYTDLKAAAEAPTTPLQKKYGDYFAACMNVEAADKLGAKSLEPLLRAIDGLKERKQITALSLELARQYGGTVLFDVNVEKDEMDSSKQILGTGQGGLTLPDRDYYLADDPRSQKLREQYVAHVTRMFVLLGDSEQKAAHEAADVMRIETVLAKGSMSRVDMRDPTKQYHIMTVAELETLSPEYDWKQYLDGLGLGSAKTLNVESPDFVKTGNEEIASESLPALKSYLRWHALHGAAPYLATPFEQESFAFFNRTLNGQKEEQPRWKRCTQLTDAALGEAVGQDWVKTNFPPDAKANTEKLVATLERALGEDIQSLPWMSDATKKEAETKLNAIRQKIGYPANWRDYSALTVKRDDLVGNLQRDTVFERNRNLAKLGKPVDEQEWELDMTPATVDAYYDWQTNDINFPAGMLQPPFYSNSMDPAVNFAGVGFVIGHELTHAFDDEGSKFDMHGNARDWFTAEDKKQFDARTDCLADQYSGFKVAEGQNLNGRLTLGENTADNGGLRIAFQALQETLAKDPSALAGYSDGKKDGYTPSQRFFIAFGQVWCQNETEQNAREHAKTDTHSSFEWRDNGTVQNFDEFGKAFGCKVGQPMMPVKSCRVW